MTVASRPVSLAAVPRAALTRTLRLRDLAFIDVGYALLVWVLGGVLSLLGALTYGELGGMLPDRKSVV